MQCPNFNQLQTIKLLTVAFIVKQLSVKCQRTSLRYPFRYRGYYYDVETGFYYLQSRYYDPEIRRFINADNLELIPELARVPGQLNLYAYCNNNPIMYTDPSGELFISLGAVIFGSSILALLGVGAAIEVKYHPIQNSIENIADAISDLIYDVQDLFKNNIITNDIINDFEMQESFNILEKNPIYIVNSSNILYHDYQEDFVIKILMAEHTKNSRPSNKNKHQKGQRQRQKERFGGEKGDARRPYHKKKRKLF